MRAASEMFHVRSSFYVRNMKNNLHVVLLTSVFFVTRLPGTCSDTNTDDTFNTLVVTRFDGLEKLYADFFRRSLKSTPSVSSRESSSSPRSKALRSTYQFKKRPSFKPINYRLLSLQFCKRLANTSYFKMNSEFYVNANARETIDETRAYYPEIFDSIYETKTLPSSAFGRKYTFSVRDTYQMLPVSVNGVEMMSKVFPCLVRDVRTRTIGQYFVSEEYGISAFNEKLTESFSIRFLFRYDRVRNLMVDGLIENPAWNTTEPYDIERTYLHQAALKRKPFRKTLCKFDNNDKLRLCASVMNSIRYRGKVEFQPTLNNVRQGCAKRTISFPNHEVVGDITHSEWMIACQVKSRENGDPLKYFLCIDGYTADTVYVLRKDVDEDKFYLDHYAQFIPVLMEKGLIDPWFFLH